jgi:uncharacterized protein (TIGR02145 family)
MKTVTYSSSIIHWSNGLFLTFLIFLISTGCEKSEGPTLGLKTSPGGSKLDKIKQENIKDIDGNVYKTVKIGQQIWMTENLKVTKFNDGTDIPLVADPDSWGALSSAGYSWYNNDFNTYGKVYGALYNWWAVGSGNLCPVGWHVPTKDEYTILTDYLGGASVAGGKLKEAGLKHWISPNYGATNESGFTALPGGLRGVDGGYVVVGNYGCWWSASEDLEDWHLVSGYQLLMYDYIGDAPIVKETKGHGCSVRCLKD